MIKYLRLFLFFILIVSFTFPKEGEDLSKKIVGDWVFQYAEAKDLHVENKNVKDSIIADIAKNKDLLKEQVLSYTKEGVLRVTMNDTITEGTYRIDGNVEIYTFDDYLYKDTLSIVGDTLLIDYDQADYYDAEGYLLYPDESKYDISKVITRYIYKRKNSR